MTNIEIGTGSDMAERRQIRFALPGFAAVIAAVLRGRRAAAGRRAIAELTTEQLRDIGLDVARPTLIVKAGLITNLMAMR